MGADRMKKFEPKLLGFLCNWCAYAGADLAGVSRFQYPANMRVIRVMCSGRVDPTFIFQALKSGVDGVAVLGCHHGDCHYQTGNYEAENKMHMTQQVLQRVGIEPERLYLDWVSAAEGKRFSEVVTFFTNQIASLGPIDQIKEYKDRLILGEKIVESIRLRWLVGKQRELMEKGNVYHEKIDKDKLTTIITENIEKEYRIQQLLSHMHHPQTIPSLAKKVSLNPTDVARYVTHLENAGTITLVDITDDKPRYQLADIEGGTP